MKAKGEEAKNKRELTKTNRNIADGIGAVLSYICNILFGVVIAYLFILSALSTSYIDKDEKTYFIKDNLGVNLLIPVLIMAVAYLAVRFLPKLMDKSANKNLHNIMNRIEKVDYKYIRRAFLIIIFAVGTIWVISTQFKPAADQKKILESAAALADGDITPFVDGGYVGRYPLQRDIVLIMYVLAKVFGDYNYVLFQMINVLALVGIYLELDRIMELAGRGKLERTLLFITDVLFLPMILYCSFIYGTVVGLLASIKAYRHIYVFLHGQRGKKGFINMALAILWMVFACAVKSNYLIFLIALVIYVLVETIRQRKLLYLVGVPLLIVVYIMSSKASQKVLVNMIGQELAEGMSSWNWVSMGLQESEKRSDGWYSVYMDRVFNQSRDGDIHSKQKQEDKAKADIQERITYFKENPDYALGFFSRKLASEWNNPTFQCFWIVQNRNSQVERGTWALWVLSVAGSNKLANFLNRLQTIILFGTMLYLFFGDKKWKRISLMFEIALLGGFIFHFAWEAKCQYTLPYYVLLMPCAVVGYVNTIKRILDLEKIKEKKAYRKNGVGIAIPVMAIMFVTLIIGTLSKNNESVHTIFANDRDQEAYDKIIDFYDTDLSFTKGEYKIIPTGDDSYTLSLVKLEDDNYDVCVAFDEGLVVVDDIENENINEKLGGAVVSQRVKLYKSDLIYRFQFLDTIYYLDLYDNEEVDMGNVEGYKKNNTSAQTWRIKKAEEKGAYYILIGKKSALTYNLFTGKVYITEFNHAENQKWYIEKSQK